MHDQELKRLIEGADAAINKEDFEALMDFYAEDAILVVKPGLIAQGKDKIRKAFEAIAEYFNHSLVVRQENLCILEAGDTALVISKTLLTASQKTDTSFSMERNATYVFKKDLDKKWRCVIDNSYGIELLESKEMER
ncbi:SgcJ/EcaC family oxidoreductase [Sporomusa sp.]|uniref:YybH family protein n=1 Tax=Sporomusa sp. TaxID=2078658 RepID=UPI002C5000D8|nr:SgcJ/EcaC family oxidoreductase [Sporomusa sp.]HWR43387.1 SgcJ/EcaC family oxidoreductase [Sporomusa sp.]